MEREYRQKKLEQVLKKCPDQLRPSDVPNWFPIGKNLVYRLIADSKLRAHRMTYGYVILKEGFIKYILDHCEESSRSFTVKQKWEDEQWLPK